MSEQVPAPAPSNQFQRPHPNKTIEAAFRYLLDRDNQGFDWLVGICYKACRGLFIPDPHSDYFGPSGADNTEHARTREFIVEWLSQYLQPYKSALADEIQESAGDFRHIGRKCRHALLKRIRTCPVCDKRKNKICLKCQRIQTHSEANNKLVNKNCVGCGTVLANNSKLVCKLGCQPLSVRTSLDVCYGEDAEGSTLSEYVVVPKRPSVVTWLSAAKPDLEVLGLYEGLVIFVKAFLDGDGVKTLTRTWAEAQGVSLKVARSRKNKFLALVEKNRSHKVVRQFYEVVEKRAGPAQPTLALAESRKTREARIAKSQAAKELAEFYKGVSPHVKHDIEINISKIEGQSVSIGQLEIEDRRKVTTFVNAGGGFREIKQIEEFKDAVKDCFEEDVLHYFGVENPEELNPLTMTLPDDYEGGLDADYPED